MLGFFPMTLILATPLTLQTTFLRTYNHGPSHSVAQTTDGGYVIAGDAWSQRRHDNDVWLIKTDAFGDTLWSRTWHGTDYDYGRSVAQTTDGGYIVAGGTFSFGAGVSDFWLIKTDASGDTMWTRTFGGAGAEGGLSVAQTTDGGYIITGWTESFGAGRSDAWLVKTDASGDTMWTRTFGGENRDGGYSVMQTTDGGYIITGETWSFGAGNNDAWLIKTDANGDTMWTRTWGDRYDDCGNSVAQTTDGGYVVTGWTESCSTRSLSVWLIRTDPDGDTIWTRTFGSGYEADGYGYSVAPTTDRGYVIVGYYVGEHDEGLWLIKTDASGDTMWTRFFGGTDYDRYQGYSAMQTADGGYVITGYDHSGWVLYTLLIKTDSDGRVVTAGKPGLNLPVGYKPGPATIARAVLYMPEPGMTNDQYPMTLLDVAGRKAMSLRPGPNDVRHLSPGVYFVRPASSVHKVIVTH